MKRWNTILGTLLLAQLALAILVYQTRPEYGAFEPRARLLTFETGTVDGLKIEDGKGGSALLRRRDGKWLLPDLADAPADSGRADQLLRQLSNLDQGFPVATTAGAAPRFKVADDGFERRITLLAGEQEIAKLYLGTSPGIRKVHARLANDAAIYAVALEAVEVNASGDAWIDPRMLALDLADLTRIELPGVTVEHEGDDWRLADLPEGQRTDGEEAHVLASKIADLEIQSLLGKEDQPAYRQNAPGLEMTLTQRDGAQLAYRFSQPENENFWVLRRSDLPYYFKVADHAVKPLKEATREQLIKQPDAAAGAEAATPAAPAAVIPEEKVDE